MRVHILLFLLLLWSPWEGAAQHGGVDQGEDRATIEAEMRLPKKRTPNFGAYKKQFKELCDAVALDMRRDRLYELLLSVSERSVDCIACRPLIGVFASACKPPVVKAPKVKPTPTAEEPELEDSEEEATQTPKPTATPELRSKQREPHIYVLSWASQIFMEIAEKSDEIADTVQAIDKLNVTLTAHPSLTAGEREYFSILATYISAPFSSVVRETVVPEKKAAPRAGSADDALDAMFAE